MAEQFPPVTINFASVKIAGAAGVPLLVVVGAIAVVFPIARWLLLLGALGGLLVSAAMILVRRRRDETDPSDDSPIRLGVASPPRRRNGSANRTPANTVRLADLRV